MAPTERNNLTIKQEKFCLEYMKDGNGARSYRDSYNSSKMSEASISQAVNELLKNPKITVRIQELREETTKEGILSIEERKRILSDIARNVAYDKEGNASFTDARGAIDILNKMDAVYTIKQEVEHKGGVQLFIPKADKDL